MILRSKIASEAADTLCRIGRTRRRRPVPRRESQTRPLRRRPRYAPQAGPVSVGVPRRRSDPIAYAPPQGASLTGSTRRSPPATTTSTWLIRTSDATRVRAEAEFFGLPLAPPLRLLRPSSMRRASCSCGRPSAPTNVSEPVDDGARDDAQKGCTQRRASVHPFPTGAGPPRRWLSSARALAHAGPSADARSPIGVAPAAQVCARFGRPWTTIVLYAVLLLRHRSHGRVDGRVEPPPTIVAVWRVNTGSRVDR